MPYEHIDSTKIKGIYRIQPKIFSDQRGWYAPTLEISELENILGLKINITQIARSHNNQSGILRGLHYQKPETQGKLVWAENGEVLDVAVDIRPNSPTFKQYVVETLSSKTQNQLWIPCGCAHGYLALTAGSRFCYVVTNGHYNPQFEKGINPFDPDLNIPWGLPRERMDLKERDLNFRNLKEIPVDELL